MEYKIIENKQLNEKAYLYTDKSGLDVYVIPKPGHSKTYAIYATKYGSIDSSFKNHSDNDFIDVPDGIAHFLEHKLFEKPYGDIFNKYAELGASANAYTSFNHTAYLFSCTDNFEKSLDVLMELVGEPYFTAETVEKEQGIIGQEINMGLDSPGRQLLYGLLKSLYFDHPVSREIAGSIESIALITHDLLYQCYDMFYNPKNMMLCIAGDVDPDAVFEQVSKNVRKHEAYTVDRGYKPDRDGVVKNHEEKAMAVSQPLFYIGYKDMQTDLKGKDRAKKMLETDILIELLTGEGSALFGTLYGDGLINSSFGYEYYGGYTFGITLIGGESKDPARVKTVFIDAVERIKLSGVERADYERAKKVVYGRYVRRFEDVERIVDNFADAWASDISIFDSMDAFNDITLDSVTKRLFEHFDYENMALSTVIPV